MSAKFDLREVKEVNEQQVTITSAIYLNFNWTDNRLMYSENSEGRVESSNQENIPKIWKPYLFIHELIQFNRKI